MTLKQIETTANNAKWNEHALLIKTIENPNKKDDMEISNFSRINILVLKMQNPDDTSTFTKRSIE